MHDDCKAQVDIEKCTRLVSFILILLLLLYGVSFLLEPKNNDDAAGFVNPNASGYLSLEKDTLDVFIVGNSDAYSGFSPMEMWKNYGFTSYISGTGKQLIGESVRAVENCLKTQKPKVVILETDQLYTNSNSAQVIARMRVSRYSTSLACWSTTIGGSSLTPRRRLSASPTLPALPPRGSLCPVPRCRIGARNISKRPKSETRSIRCLCASWTS